MKQDVEKLIKNVEKRNNIKITTFSKGDKGFYPLWAEVKHYFKANRSTK